MRLFYLHEQQQRQHLLSENPLTLITSVGQLSLDAPSPAVAAAAAAMASQGAAAPNNNAGGLLMGMMSGGDGVGSRGGVQQQQQQLGGGGGDGAGQLQQQQGSEGGNSQRSSFDKDQGPVVSFLLLLIFTLVLLPMACRLELHVVFLLYRFSNRKCMLLTCLSVCALCPAVSAHCCGC
jgi:hypothetical protein